MWYNLTKHPTPTSGYEYPNLTTEVVDCTKCGKAIIPVKTIVLDQIFKPAIWYCSKDCYYRS